MHCFAEGLQAEQIKARKTRARFVSVDMVYQNLSRRQSCLQLR